MPHPGPGTTFGMQQRRIGDRHVGAIGLGAMPMSLENRPDEARSLRTIHAALDSGVTLIDTADAYSTGGDDTGHNERLIAKALSTYSGDADDVLVATKAGHYRPADGSWLLDGRPEYVKRACEASLRALGVEAIGLYQYHRPDPQVPYAETLGAFADLQQQGKVRLVGVSNANVQQIELAQSIVGLASVQNEFSPAFRSSAGELRYCGEHGIAFLPWSPLGGMGSAGELGSRFAAFGDVARVRGVSAQQVALAWILAQGEHVIPIPGSSRPETITASAAAAQITLSEQELRQLDSA